MKRQKGLLFGMFLVLFLVGYASGATPTGNVYEVVYPLGRSTTPVKPLAPRLDTLEGKTICELWNNVFQGNVTFLRLEELLAKKYPGVKFVSYTKFGPTHGATESQTLAALTKRLKEYGCNAVISGNGG